MTAGIPVKLAGIQESKGSLEVGKDVDIIVLDQDYQVKYCFVRGAIHKKP